MFKPLQFVIVLTVLLPSVIFARYQPAQADPMVTETVQLTAPDANPQARFGLSVAISGDTAVIGAPAATNNAIPTGEVYLFTYDGSDWLESDKLLPSAVGDTYFGFSVAVDDDTIAVGAPYSSSGTNNSGAVYVFAADGGGWSEVVRFATGGGGPVLSDLFGWAVALNGDLLLVGAPLDDIAYVYNRDAAGWQETAVLSGDDTQFGDRFGFALATDGERILAGAPQDDNTGNNAGAAFLFLPDGSGDWQQEAKLLPTGARFGWSVALDGATAVSRFIACGPRPATRFRCSHAPGGMA
ncbi:MAG: hypothetical protein IPM39_19985 [Chloroflexi bacterium]|nr:hypothetical protein [Chloroflexota bacterium]